MKRVFLIAIILSALPIFISMQRTPDFEILVPDETTAIKIAKAIWLPIFGEEIYTCKPFTAKLINQKVWLVEGTVHTLAGGAPFIEIQKSDCKILKVGCPK